MTKNSTVLIVDDEEIGREMLTALLTGQGYQLAFARNGYEALSQAKQLMPDVILLDEVLGVGDEAFRQKSTTAMKKRIKSNKTVVLVSHNLSLMREVCDRVVWIEDGETKEDGDVKTILENYLQFIKRH